MAQHLMLCRWNYYDLMDNIMAEETKTKDKKKSKRSKKTVDIEQFEAVQQELGELKDKYLRLLAEFENFKKRTVREKMDLMKSAAQDTLSGLLPVLDDFDRAKKSAEDEGTEEIFSEGVTLVYNKLNSTLKNMGLTEFDATGEVFDSELHEAVTEIPAPSDEMKGKVIDTIEKGYRLNDRIIRYAKVVVGK